MLAHPPLPVVASWAPAWLAPRGTQNRDWAFTLVDAEGAYANDGTRRHSAVDWFAPGGTAVVAPQAGRVRRAYVTNDTSGAVYGGILEIEQPDGFVWVMRHVDPVAGVGSAVVPGQLVARVSRWDGGAPHLHLEIWKSASGGYRHENMIDPASVTWADLSAGAPDHTGHAFEELPHKLGGHGPVVVGQARGYAVRATAEALAVLHRALGRKVSTLVDKENRWYVLWWKPGTYGAKFRFGPWAVESTRDYWMASREQGTGRVMRPFEGRASLYPWPRSK